MVRALARHARGHWFESSTAHHLKQPRCQPPETLNTNPDSLDGVKTSNLGTTSWHHFQLYQDFLDFKKSTRGITPASEEWFRWTVLVFLQAQPANIDVTRLTTGQIVEFLGIYNHMPWRKHGFYRALKTFYKWISTTYKVPNPFMDEFGNSTIEPPKLPQKVLPALQPEQVLELIQAAKGARNKAIVALLADSGARRSELASLKAQDVDLDKQRIRLIHGKGGKEGKLVFGKRTKQLLQEHMKDCAQEVSLFGLTSYSVQTMLRRLADRTGIPCTAHSFRRGFATQLRKAGLSELDICELGRWSSTAMVKRYTRSYEFEDAASRYQAIV